METLDGHRGVDVHEIARPALGAQLEKRADTVIDVLLLVSRPLGLFNRWFSRQILGWIFLIISR